MTEKKSGTNYKLKTKHNRGRILKNEQILPFLYQLRIQHQGIADLSSPGQFVNIKVSDDLAPLLRRPFSISSSDRKNGWFEILFQVFGKGTEILSRFEPGVEIDFLGPLGNSFRIKDTLKNSILIAGGVGIAPLKFLSEQLNRKKIKTTLFWGAQSAEMIKSYSDLLPDDNCKKYFSTEDGSLGYQGFITELFLEKIKIFDKNSSAVFSCGPNPMLKKVKEIACNNSIPCQVSMETMMGCGFGACMGCNVLASGENVAYYYVCTDGPVFNAEDIVFDD